MGIDTVDELPKGETGICIVRSHGMEPNKIEEMTQNGFEVVDLTCLDVKKVQQKAIELSKEDYLVLILGKPAAELALVWNVTTTSVNAVLSGIAAVALYMPLRHALKRAGMFMTIGNAKEE